MNKPPAAKEILPFFCLLLFLLLPFGICFGQTSLSDTAFLAKARAAAYLQYASKIAEQSPLVNGVQYRDYLHRPNTTGIPYFGSDDWIDGNVVYDSGYFTNVPLMYDEITDKLIVEQPFSHFKLELISEKVKYFQLLGHTFVRIVQTRGDSTLVTGFYDLLYNGKVKAYARRSKELKETALATVLQVEYLDHISFLIEKDGVYYRFKTKVGLLRVFRDRKKALRKKIRAYPGEISFYKDREGAIAIIARLYDESANP